MDESLLISLSESEPVAPEKKEEEKKKKEQDEQVEEELGELASQLYPYTFPKGLPPGYHHVPLGFTADGHGIHTVLCTLPTPTPQQLQKPSFFSLFFSPPSPSPSTKWVLFFHGNGEAVENYMDGEGAMVVYFHRRGWNVALGEYRGYSRFSTPARSQTNPFEAAKVFSHRADCAFVDS
jgi:hypothetical protein